ncbi:hypothetical protein [Actinoplanes aureus]|uniref:Uncharacterized protein n=1 Tax=Actinoplanes aureus TaxID=2792083 RepID=A0A931FY38_9ACTN|nr:hypothetical protein [Actinoplanes aureus]MBG0563175.1 hypothetical protein [Actinoplanes aureus]
MENFPSSPDYPDRVGGPDVDETLSLLNGVINIIDASCSIVLSMPGGVLTGRLVKKSTWYQEWFEAFKKGEGRAGEFSGAFQGLLSEMGRLRADNEFIDHSGAYLHVVGGVLNTGSKEIGPMPWRVRQDHVAAWSIGTAPG